jgi:hypothetical protein
MTTRWKLWLGASALAMASGASPAAQIVSPAASSLLGLDLIDEAQAQESGEGEGAETECTTEEGGEGEEGGECPEPTGEEGEGEGG